MSATIAGSLVGGALGAFGKKPVIPDLPTLDIGIEQKKSIADNLSALPSLQQLAGKTNQFSFDQIAQMLEKAIPGFMGGLRTAGANAQSLARGEIPEDVARAVQNTSASRALGGGYSGSQFGTNRTARDLGLTSLNLMGEGQNRLLGLGGFAKSTFPTFDFTQAFISPMQRLNFDWQQNMAQFQVQLMKNQVAAAPDPAMADLAGAFDNFFNTWKNIGTSALGGGFGGMGGSGSAGGGAGSPTTTQARGLGSNWFNSI